MIRGIKVKRKTASALVGVGLCFAMSAGLTACGTQNTETPDQNAAPAQSEAVVDSYLAEIQGGYEPLFDVMGNKDNAQTWYDALAEYCGIENETKAETVRQAIIDMFTAESYGAEAEELAAADPTYSAFHCGFSDGIAQFEIEGNTISGLDENGNVVFSSEYTLVGEDKNDFGAMNDMYSEFFTDETWPMMKVYEATDAPDEFKYFGFCGDTPAETYHIEFRYGPNRADVSAYYSGDCAYFMPSAFPIDGDDEMLENVINLLVEENAENFSSML